MSQRPPIYFDYGKRKRAETMRLLRAGRDFVLVLDLFDADTGEKCGEERVPLKMTELAERRDFLAGQVRVLDEMIGDLQALSVLAPEGSGREPAEIPHSHPAPRGASEGGS